MPTVGTAGFEMTLTAGGETVAKAIDVELSAQGEPIDVTTRGSGGWKEFIQGLKEWGVTVDQLWVPTNTGLQALKDAFFSGAEIAVVLTDPDGNGWQGNAIVVDLKRGEPLNAGVKLPITLKGSGALEVIGPAS